MSEQVWSWKHTREGRSPSPADASRASRVNAKRYGTGDSHCYLRRQLHLGDICNTQDETDDSSTAEIAANAPRYRRKSSTFIDGIHDVAEEGDRAPAQLYSTMSGRLFHSGRIAIVMVGLPARGKTHISVSMARYLQWLGVKTRIFHLGDYRRATVGEKGDVPEDYFFPNASPASVMLRQKILKKCREDIYAWLNHENGQVAIYDAVNPTASGRRSLAKEFAKHDVQTLFLESYVDDDKLLRENARNVKISSPDFDGMDPDDAAMLYLRRIEMKIPTFETMAENELNYIKMINAGQTFFYNNVSFNYLSHRIVFYLTNTHIKSRTTFFVRAGSATEEDSYKADAPLSQEGVNYARIMSDTLLRHREKERADHIASGGPDMPLRPLTVWTSTRLRTLQTSEPFKERGYKVRQRSQMSQINPGVCEKLAERAIRRLYPEEVEKHGMDPYHHRYPRAESYHDLAVRLEPIILELEREQNDLLIIAHESVLRVLYAYLMHCSTRDIPSLKFPRNEIIEIIPAAYQNEAKRIHIPGLDPRTVAGSPEDIRIPVASIPGSGTDSPAPFPDGLGSPAEPVVSIYEKPPEKIVSTAADAVKNRLTDED
ncbi:bifunctional 6-phosphofructo-2-kinase/fructose-2,6-bisphosphate 2-phosphatase [Pseudomassariella vexata]|uniref:Bifunctional 6-phosphofructo-2-kinase/fructose-2,6-bisphosphate 2-phosphatase n=1 Tax=Pseudomassariella vexata TaxID=1141098 RepID=A0A1Y2EL64_9PEZI|nr:bifunctional 6-phosphofructo-2-kinase/fructose-2,6-bisphosphate 2-phosphatase [Pseudomassariella vexata]ORY71605.1 bifunctional 6-phosphofructo-2-kinase/fructose-2,6-bisphosphate 2-phosphatase [Pseudomassariella vexata]